MELSAQTKAASMTPQQDDKRSSFRITINSTVKLKADSSLGIPSQTYNAQTINLSEGGLAVALDSKTDLSSPLLVEFSLKVVPMQFQGEVVWRKVDNGKSYCGMRFTQ